MITSYDTMPYGIYLKLLDVIEDKDRSELDKQVALVALLDGKTETEVLDLPLDQFRERTAAMSFLEAPVPPRKPGRTFPESITLAGQKCTILHDVEAITTAQFVDYQSLAQMGNAGLPGIVALMIVPEGKAYGHTGAGDPLAYDVEAIRRAVAEEMTVTQVNDLAAFFLQEWDESLNRSLTSLSKKAKDPMVTARMAEIQRLRAEIRSSLNSDGWMR